MMVTNQPPGFVKAVLKIAATRVVGICGIFRDKIGKIISKTIGA